MLNYSFKVVFLTNFKVVENFKLVASKNAPILISPWSKTTEAFGNYLLTQCNYIKYMVY